MRRFTLFFTTLASLCAILSPATGAEPDALAISAVIRAKHMPFGTILDPYYTTITGNTLAGYSRCGDSALWTGAYLAAEAFRYKVTRSADALDNVKAAVAGLKALSDVTGNNRLARCMVLANSPYAPGIASEEAANTIIQNPPWIWVGNISRDQIVGAFFGMGVAFDLVDDPGVKSTISALATLLSRFIADHQWSPNDDISSTFELRPEELQMILQVTRHVNPADTISGPFIVPPVNVGVLVDVQSNSSYFKFNLDYMTFYNLVQYQNNGDNLDAYKMLRSYTASHQNPFFNMVDRALQGSNAVRDAEARSLLDQWLLRPKRDLSVNLTPQFKNCSTGEACAPVPIPVRPPTDFLWQRDPFQLIGGGNGNMEGSGVDYILPYWMGRYYGVIPAVAVQSSAALVYNLAPNSLASLYAINLASGIAAAASQPLPAALGGVSLIVTDSTGVSRNASLTYVSPTQINFVVPDGTATGAATLAINNGTTTQTATATVQAIAPALFSADQSGTGVAAATAISTHVANPKLQSPVPVFGCGDTGCSSVPIVLGVDTPIYVSFYGTGMRNRSNIGAVTLTIHGVSAPVLYAGPSPSFTGLDQVNVVLPISLRGSGESDVVLTVDGQTANTVRINLQ